MARVLDSWVQCEEMMTNDEQWTELLTSGKAEWMPGMLALATRWKAVLTGFRCTDGRRPNYPDEYDWPHDMGLRFPDWTDPATLGCLLGQVRERHGDPTMSTTADDPSCGWWVDGWVKSVRGMHNDEAAALLAALAAAPTTREP